MIYIGKIDKTKFKTFVKTAYKNYKDATYDLTMAKCIILDFIMKTHITRQWYSTNPDDYRLNLCPLYGLKINLKLDDDITYFICVKSGKVYT